MVCIRCNSDRILSFCGKCSDLFNAEFKGEEKSGYVFCEVGIGGGDCINMNICLECGQVQDEFPKPDPDFDN